MRVEIFDKSTQQKVVRLKLTDYGDSVAVVAVDADGELMPGGYLAIFRVDGTVHLPCAVNRALGLQLDSEGSLKVYSNE